ncbi:MAG: MBL fold metallo-hydrolase [Xanthobacteraceae bacterium]|nr:MBL fold metallo-hydrolase [Xanthobacteraceae bacterium]
MRLQFVGSGDAFGSGGRFNTCFHVVGARTNFLIDCGASSLIAMNRFGIDRNAIDLILLTHFHSDHSGGVPFFLLDAQFPGRRTRPLTIAGPAGLKAWFPRLMDVAFEGSTRSVKRFEVTLVELMPHVPWGFEAAEILPVLVRHGPPPNGYFGYRISMEGKVLAYSGDTEWTDNLILLGRDADLFVSEAYVYDKPLPLHMSYRQLLEKLPLIRPKRLILTHMSDDMLGRADAILHEVAEDGKTVEI